ncbi:MAG: hypothetical protein AAGG56_07165 [Pseudomonadota bacterium]
MNCEQLHHLVLHVAGPLRLCTADGQDVTPKSQKAQGLLALLATNPGLSRPRSWVQDKLWSENTPERGASNLRQCVHRLRKEVAIEGEWLISDSQRIALDQRLVTVELGRAAGETWLSSDPPEFCEGLDILDPEFEDWIRDCRTEFWNKWDEIEAPVAATPPPSKLISVRPVETHERTVLLIAPPQSQDDDLRNLEAILCTDIASNVSHIGGVEIRYQANERMAPGLEDAVCLQVRTFRFGESISLQSVLSDPTNGAVFWSDVQHLSSLGARSFPSDYANLVAHVTSATALQFAEGSHSGSSTRKAYRAICDFLSYDTQNFEACDELLSTVHTGPSSASVNAWRAYFRIGQIIERTTPDLRKTAEEAITFARYALELDSLNPVAVSLSSAVALHVENRADKAWSLTKSAVERGASSPIVHALWSDACAAIGQTQASIDASKRALSLSSSQPFRGFWYMTECFSLIQQRDISRARDYARYSHQLAPTFRPSLRYLIALSNCLGDEAAADDAKRKLQKIEPGFDVELFSQDDYPTLTLRKTGLVKSAVTTEIQI